MPHPAIDAAEKFKVELGRYDAQALNRLIDAYRRMYARLSAQVDALITVIGDEPMTKGQIVRMTRYKSLLGQVADELQGYQSLTINEVERAAELGIKLGTSHATQMISYSAVGGPELAASFNRLPKEAVQQLLGFLSPDGPLYARLRILAPHTAELVSDALVSGIGLGYNPRKIAGYVRDAFGKGLTDALRFTRTAQIWSYREASRANYIANADVVEGWIWYAALDDRVCMSCVANHGKFFPLSQPLNDHHNGRCTMIPAVRGMEPIGIESGEDWFNRKSETIQRRMMGKGKFAAWKDGKFGIGDLTTERVNEVYGPMRVEQTLKALS